MGWNTRMNQLDQRVTRFGARTNDRFSRIPVVQRLDRLDARLRSYLKASRRRRFWLLLLCAPLMAVASFAVAQAKGSTGSGVVFAAVTGGLGLIWRFRYRAWRGPRERSN